jgi:hypothetical protein
VLAGTAGGFAHVGGVISRRDILTVRLDGPHVPFIADVDPEL